MANVIAEWTPNDPAEGVVQYNLLLDDVLAGHVNAPPFTFANVPPGAHNFGVQAQNSDPAPNNVSDVAATSFTVPHGKPSKPTNLVVHL